MFRHWNKDRFAYKGLAVAVCLLFATLLNPGSSTAAKLSIAIAVQDDAPDSVDRDYSEELPRIKPLSPEQALESFDIKEGFRIELVAAEPTVTDPIAMSFDEAGRMYVIEMRDYSEHPEDNLGRVRLLEDSDADGYFEKSSIFADELSWPTAIFASQGGVYVAAAPHIFFLRDQDGDGVADEKRIVFTGFGRSNVQGLVNSFRWGLDRRIHGATSSSGASLTKPGSSDSPLVLRGRDFAIDPLSESITPMAGGGQHGLSFNSWGEKFVCANSNHIQFIVYADRYLSRNPYVAGRPVRLDIATDGPQADVYRTSPVEPWRTVRTRLRRQGIVPGPVERGGLAAGYFTGATGVTIYRGNAWPEEFREWAIIGDVGSNLVHRKQLTDRGVLYAAERFDQESEFLTSTDNWFRPVQFANGPDGGLYILDMYREVIEHPKSLPPVIKKHLDLDSGRERGRIYRIVAEDHRSSEAHSLANATTAELVSELASDNGWTRETASRLLYERQDKAAIAPLYQLLEQNSDPITTNWALSAIVGLQANTAQAMAIGLNHSNEFVRRYALELSEPLLANNAELLERALALAEDPSPRVRMQVAFTLGESSGPRRNRTLADLAIRDVDQPYILMAVQSSLHEGAAEVLIHLLNNEQFNAHAEGRAMIQRIADQVARQGKASDIAQVVDWVVRDASQHEQSLTTFLVAALSENATENFLDQLQRATGGEYERLLQAAAVEAAQRLMDDNLAVADRLKLIQDVRWLPAEEAIPTLMQLVKPDESAELQSAAIQMLSRYRDPSVASKLIEQWPTMTPSRRRQTMEVLMARESWIGVVLDAVESGDVAHTDIDLGRLKGVASSSHEALSVQAQRIIDSLNLSSREDVIEQYRAALTQAGDPERGASIFDKQCANCHQVGGRGKAIGPNLEAMISRGDETVLINMLDPNREVNPAYLSYTIATIDGLVVAGMITEESANTVTVQRTEGEPQTILRLDIEEIQSSGLSLMPEGLEEEMDVQAVADLLTYLKKSQSSN